MDLGLQKSMNIYKDIHGLIFILSLRHLPTDTKSF